MVKYFSLFSGIGGFEYGIEKVFIESYKSQYQTKNTKWGYGMDIRQNGFKTSCIGYSEINKYATTIYRYHYPEQRNYGDAIRIVWEEIPDFDLLLSGFPCQSFSIAGKRKGFNDTRGSLFFEICRALQIKRPRLFLLENVKGLLSHDEGRTFLVILQSLDELGYDCQWQVLNSKNYGVPQNRERVFIVGHIRGTSRPEVFLVKGKHTKIDITKGKIFWDDYNKRTTEECPALTAPEHNTIRLIDGGQAYRVYDKKGISPALPTPSGGHHIPKIDEEMKIRRLTPIECERLQGFPDNWTKYGIDEHNNKIEISDTQRYKCLGNAVTTNVITAMMERLI